MLRISPIVFPDIHRSSRIVVTLVLLLVGAPVKATFSIVAIDPDSREVGSAGATCINNFDLGPYISYLVPGQGAANYQAYGDPSFFFLYVEPDSVWLVRHRGHAGGQRIRLLCSGSAKTDHNYATRPD